LRLLADPTLIRREIEARDSLLHDRLELPGASHYLSLSPNENLVRNLPACARFLQVAAATNARMINYTNVASDAHMPRQTVKRISGKPHVPRSVRLVLDREDGENHSYGHQPFGSRLGVHYASFLERRLSKFNEF
jgi:hypothetical protein